MSDYIDLFGEEETPQEEEKEIKPEKVTLFDVISLVTTIKKSKEIIENDGIFWGVFSCTMAKNGRIYETLSDVVIDETLVPETRLNENGVGTKVKLMELKFDFLRGLIKYMSYSPDCIVATYWANQIVDLPLENVLLVLEEHTPRKRLFIKNLGGKVDKEADKDIIEETSQMFHVSHKRAIDYLETMGKCEKLDEYKAIFNTGFVEDAPKKSRKKGPKKNIVVNF